MSNFYEEDKMYTVYTFHHTMLFFDVKTCKLCFKKVKNENILDVKAIFYGNKLSLVIDINNINLYIYKFIEDGKVLISNDISYINYIKNKDNTISILSEFGFLSARKNGNVLYTQWNNAWEKFTLIDNIKSEIVENAIKLFYWDKNFDGKYNVGDILSKYIVEKMSGKKVIHCPKNSPEKLCAIGSIISSATLESGGIFWGSGSHAKSVDFFASNPKFLAVRGPLTRKMLLDTGYQCPDIYGDPALLLPEFYHKPAISPKYKLGVIGHWRHREKLDCKDGVLFIDILRIEDEITSFIDEICSCEKILSSSLHGIIIANAYGVPARWFMMENFPLEGNPYKKFHDYFMSVDMPIQKPLMLKEHVVIDENNKFDIDMTVDLKINLNDLKDVFPYK